MQVKVGHCLCPVQGPLVWVTKWSAYGCQLCWAWRCLGKAKLRTKVACPYFWTWSHLVRGTDHGEARFYFSGVHEPLGNFRKVPSVNLDSLFVWKSQWKGLKLLHKLCGQKSQQITKVIQSQFSQVDRDSNLEWACTCRLSGVWY